MSIESKAVQYFESKGWMETAKFADDHVILEVCPICLHDGYKFYCNIAPEKEGSPCDCKSCSWVGNLYKLRQELGDTQPKAEAPTELTSTAAWGNDKKPDVLPNVAACYNRLINDIEALDYLMNTRGWSRNIIDELQLGLMKQNGKGYLVIPYLDSNGQIVFSKFRTLPPAEKAFFISKGHPTRLYNDTAIQPEMDELILVEGEADTITMLDMGVLHTVGVPGAGNKKTEWITKIDKARPKKIYILYDNDTAGQKGAEELAKKLMLNTELPTPLSIVLPPFQTHDGEEGKDVSDWRRAGHTLEEFEELKKAALPFEVRGVATLSNALDRLDAELSGDILAPRYASKWASLNRKLGGFERGDVVDIIAGEKQGKGGRTSTPVLLANGSWTTLGQLHIGDQLASVDGQPSIVTGVFPRGEMDMFRVMFCDGRFTDTTADHLWKVQHVNLWDDGWHVYTTDAINREYSRGGASRDKPGALNKSLYVPLSSGDFGNDVELTLHPWVLGALIGDGGFSNSCPTFTTADTELHDKFSSLVCEYGITLKPIGEIRKVYTNGNMSNPRSAQIHFRLSKDRDLEYDSTENYITEQLRRLELWGLTSESKFIPREYLQAGKEQRWELLRGLMDTDGTASNRHGTLSYCTVSERLAHDFVYLVRSLGGIAKVGKALKKHFRYKGEMRTGQPAYVIVVRLPEREKAFSLARKLQRAHPRVYQPRMVITHIVPVGKDQAVCISVSHPSQLYITDDFIVTHNTTFAINLIDHLVSEYKEPGLVECLEMPDTRLARKWVSMITHTDDSPLQTPEDGRAKMVAMKAAIVKAKEIASARQADLLFGYTQVKDPEEIYDTIRQAVRRYGVRFVVLDNVQLLADQTLKNQSHRTTHLSQISKKLKALALELEIVMFRIVQPNRIREGEVASHLNADGSSQLAKDCDATIALHRNTKMRMSADELKEVGFMDEDQSFEPQLYTRVSITRYAAGGMCTLKFQGEYSLVTEWSNEEAAGLAKPVQTGLHMETIAVPPSQY